MSSPINVKQFVIDNYKEKIIEYINNTEYDCIAKCGDKCSLKCSILNIFNDFFIDNEEISDILHNYIKELLRIHYADNEIDIDFKEDVNIIKSKFEEKLDLQDEKIDSIEISIGSLNRDKCKKILKNKFIEHINDFLIHHKKGCFVTCGFACLKKCKKYNLTEDKFNLFYLHLSEFNDYIKNNIDKIIQIFNVERKGINLIMNEDDLKFVYDRIDSFLVPTSINLYTIINPKLKEIIKYSTTINKYVSNMNVPIDDDKLSTILKDTFTVEINKCHSIIKYLSTYLDCPDNYYKIIRRIMMMYDNETILLKYLERNKTRLADINKVITLEFKDEKNPPMNDIQDRDFFKIEIDHCLQNNIEIKDSIKFNNYIITLQNVAYHSKVIENLKKNWEQLLVARKKELEDNKEFDKLLLKIEHFKDLNSYSFYDVMTPILKKELGIIQGKKTYYYQKNNDVWSEISKNTLFKKISDLTKIQITYYINLLNNYTKNITKTLIAISLLNEKLEEADKPKIIKSIFKNIDLEISKVDYINLNDEKVYLQFLKNNYIITGNKYNKIEKNSIFKEFIQKFNLPQNNNIYNAFNRHFCNIFKTHPGLFHSEDGYYRGCDKK
jgi:hypothetical protein